MSVASKIIESVHANLVENTTADGVRFIDELLALAADAGEISCTLAGERALRFQVLNHPACEVELDRAKAKLRMLCARLAVVCGEEGQNLSLYGGEGLICKSVPLRIAIKNTSAEQTFTIASAAPIDDRQFSGVDARGINA